MPGFDARHGRRAGYGRGWSLGPWTRLREGELAFDAAGAARYGAGMGVELELIKPDGDGVIVSPPWDEQGDLLPGVERACIHSLKWAFRDSRLADLELFAPELIPPSQLRAGAERGLQRLLAEISVLDPHYAWMAEEAGSDIERIEQVLSGFVGQQDWVLGDPKAQQVAFALASEFADVYHLLSKLLRFSAAGYWGRWSY